MGKYGSYSLIACSIASTLAPFYIYSHESSHITFSRNITEEKMELGRFLVSEKLDGIRALWTGKELLTRKGNKIVAPSYFTDGLPKQMIEGELWAGRGRFNFVQNTVLDTTPNLTDWSEIKFMLFNLPNSKEKFKERYVKLHNISQHLQLDHVQVIKHFPINSYQELITLLDDVERKKGEGLMLKQADDFFSKPIKIKKHMDSEGVVIGYTQGKGKHANGIGTLRLKLANGKVLSLGSGLSDELRYNPPALGQLVTFRYNGYTSTGLPRFARFLRIREPE